MTDAASVGGPSRTARVDAVNALRFLLRADVTAQLRSYRSLVLNFALPAILLFAASQGKRASRLGGPNAVVNLALTVGLVSIGTVAYSMAVARDRDNGVLQRLRATPAPTWTIMGSRWIVQLGAVVVMSVMVFIVAALLDNITFTATGYFFTLLVALLR